MTDKTNPNTPKGIAKGLARVSDVSDTHGNRVTRWEGPSNVQLSVKLALSSPVKLYDVVAWYWLTVGDARGLEPLHAVLEK
jgi:hypothetical protein